MSSSKIGGEKVLVKKPQNLNKIKLSLSIKKKKSFFEKIELYESVDRTIINKLLNSELIREIVNIK